jgi:uncharacterized protein (DUF927 family)
MNNWNYAGGFFKLTADKGLIYVEPPDSDGNRESTWLCSPLYVVAKTRDSNSRAWGRLLEWPDDDKVVHRWAMPAELLKGDGTDVVGELLHQGLRISPTKKARTLLSAYLQACPVDARARCVNRLGWHGDVFVLPGEVVGHAGEHVVFQNAHAVEPAFSISGTVDEWRTGVAALAQGNGRMVFAISAAFAGTLLEPAGEDSGGFHLRGPSSSGKTTALALGASVWGKPEAYRRTWRATANGLEGLASLHNDLLLILDELGQIDPREAGECSYLLANGRGKSRATRTGTACQAASWRLLFVSAGEPSLAALMSQAGRKPTPGQEIRLAEEDVDAGAGMGAIEELHGYDSSAALVLAMRDAAAKYLRRGGRRVAAIASKRQSAPGRFHCKWRPAVCR